MDDFDTPSILAVGAKLANLQRAKSTNDVDPRVQLVEVDSGLNHPGQLSPWFHLFLRKGRSDPARLLQRGSRCPG